MKGLRAQRSIGAGICGWLLWCLVFVAALVGSLAAAPTPTPGNDAPKDINKLGLLMTEHEFSWFEDHLLMTELKFGRKCKALCDDLLSRCHKGRKQEKPTQEALANILSKHKHWLSLPPGERSEHLELRADLCGADLTGFSFFGVDLRYARLAGASLRSSRLCHTDVSGADLICADLRGVEVTGTRMIEADLACANLSLRGPSLLQCAAPGLSALGGKLWSPDPALTLRQR
jgi:hypothetical protein